MHPQVASAHCATLAEWADTWERSSGSLEGAAEVAYLLRRAIRKMAVLTGCEAPEVDIPEDDLVREVDTHPFREG
jgi:hypothetical protein